MAANTLVPEFTTFTLPTPAPATTFRGDAAVFTGRKVLLHGGLFFEVRMTEGRRTGETFVVTTRPSTT